MVQVENEIRLNSEILSAQRAALAMRTCDMQKYAYESLNCLILFRRQLLDAANEKKNSALLKREQLQKENHALIVNALKSLHNSRNETDKDLSYRNAEKNPLEASHLFWDISGLNRFQHDVKSMELIMEIRDSVISDQVKNSCLEDFKMNMDASLFNIACCAVCNRSSVDSIPSIHVSELSNLLLLTEDRFNELYVSPFKHAYHVYWSDDFNKRAYYLNPALINPGNLAPICKICNLSLTEAKLPKYCLANGYDLGNWSNIGLSSLSHAEKLAISLYRPLGKILKLLPPLGLGSTAQQTGSTAQTTVLISLQMNYQEGIFCLQPRLFLLDLMSSFIHFEIKNILVTSVMRSSQLDLMKFYNGFVY
jgi:hypothetical protein